MKKVLFILLGGSFVLAVLGFGIVGVKHHLQASGQQLLTEQKTHLEEKGSSLTKNFIFLFLKRSILQARY